ncbi:Dioxygenase [Sphingomonas sp. YR710]|nr:intradiol ring-cleavage dioxygenase [Sphingomonas sp. YR710]SDD43532.1 Dioxygenase [Sphingomonas sp. YR710]
MMRDGDDHDQGLAHDLTIMARQILGRRQALGWLASVGSTALLAGCGGDDSSTASSSTTATTASTSTTSSTTSTGSTTTGTTTTTTSSSGACIADPTETAGPYPADGTNSSSGSTSNVLTLSGIVRSDIRASFISSTTVAAGVQVKLTLTLVNVNNSCLPLSGYAIYLWHCDQNGSYSLYSVPAESYLRGVLVTDGNGQVTFTTIFPGCYSGRYPHIHLEIFSSLAAATSGRASVLTTQLAMPRDICSAVYSSGGYTQSASNLSAITTATDNVFGDNTSAQIAAQTPAMTGNTTAGYTATVTVGVAL